MSEMSGVTSPPGHSSHSPEQQPRKRRQRARQACIPCRQRKRKCDANSPCDMCATYGYDCHYPEDKSPVASFAQRSWRTKDATSGKGVQQGSSSGGGGVGGSGRPPLSPVDGVTVRSAGGDDEYRPPGVSTDEGPSPESLQDPGIMEFSRSRYMMSSSSAAFAQALGQELQSSRPPRLHHFGYSWGVRPEERSELHDDLCLLITSEELERYSGSFFANMAPMFDVFDQREYTQRCRAYYDGSNKDAVFASIIAGIVANASYMQVYSGHPREMEIVQYAKKILDDPESSRRPSTDLVAGWLLRVLYLRASSSPNAAWFASCSATHLAEANGLHDEQVVRRLAQVQSNRSAAEEGRIAERLRRIFWIVWSCNWLTSYEFGRTPVVLANMTVSDPTPMIGNHLHLMVACAKTIPRAWAWSTGAEPSGSTKTRLHSSMAALLAIPDDDPFISLTKCDICCSNYRRMRQQRVSITSETVDQILRIGNAGLEAAAAYAAAARPWFNALGATFQYTCVLIAIDKPAASACVPRALQVLESFVKVVDTPATREALLTARLLLRDATGKKKRELTILEAVDVSENIDEPMRMDMNMLPPDDAMDFGVNWDQVFDSSYASWLESDDLFRQMS